MMTIFILGLLSVIAIAWLIIDIDAQRREREYSEMRQWEKFKRGMSK